MTRVEAAWERFPQTRYTGSKRKLLGFLGPIFAGLEFETALDPFCGTGCVAYLLKCMGKRVTACDALESNVVGARALVENRARRLGGELDDLLDGLPDEDAPVGMVERVFDGVFFEREENRFIDQVIGRIGELDGPGRDLALYALFQACLAKRPYNLFHRANLYMRRAEVKRGFGNKTTWDTPFPAHMKKIAAMADAAVFDSGVGCFAIHGPAEEIEPQGWDMVYLDPPYVSGSGTGVDYLDFYHFLEGLCLPATWEGRILQRYKHKTLDGKGTSPWADPVRIGAQFRAIIERFAGSTMVVSYRSDGIPGIDEIAGFMKAVGKDVEILDAGKYTYALSRNRRSREVVLVGR